MFLAEVPAAALSYESGEAPARLLSRVRIVGGEPRGDC